MTANHRTVFSLLNERTFEDHPEFQIRSPLLMTKEEFADMGPLVIRFSECRDLAEGLRPHVCLSELTLQPIATDDTRSCASTPLRKGDMVDSHEKCCPCGVKTQFGFDFCSDCHFMEGRRRAKQRAAQVAPSTGAHICWLCKQHPTQSAVHLCTECFERAS